MEIPLALVERLCKELPELGTHEVILAGDGEPFLHPHLFEIIAAFKRAGCRVQLFTNGTLIDETNARLILDSGLDILNVSFWANSPEEYEKCHPGVDPINFQKTLKGIKTATALKAKRKTANPTILLKQPLNRFNYKSIETRIRLAQDTGCDGVKFDTYRHREFTSAALSREEIGTLCEDLSVAKKRLEYLSLEHNIDEVLLKYRLGETAWHELPCYIPWLYMRVGVDGTIWPCICSIPLGNLNKSSLQEIWNGPEYRFLRGTTLTTKGLASLGAHCDCNWCCLAHNNHQIHRFFKWLAPFVRQVSNLKMQ